MERTDGKDGKDRKELKNGTDVKNGKGKDWEGGEKVVGDDKAGCMDGERSRWETLTLTLEMRMRMHKLTVRQWCVVMTRQQGC